jgi:acetyl-CoA C-acetyltransferase
MGQAEVFIVAATRTPIGSFQGALSSVSAPRLGAVAIEAAVQQAALDKGTIDEVFMGNVLSAGLGQAPARQAAIYAGLPTHVPATTISKVCGSGLAAVIHAARSIACGDNQIAVAGGMESMTNAPYLLPRARSGYRMGHGQLIDGMIQDGLWDPYHDLHMGSGGELCAREFDFSRAAQDAYARESYARARKAQSDGDFAAELAPVCVKQGKREELVSSDEEPGRTDLSRMDTLKPVFEADGTITPANASKINDGASALVLASAEAVRKHMRSRSASRPRPCSPRAARSSALGSRPRTSTCTRSTRPSPWSPWPARASWGSTRAGSTCAAARSRWATRSAPRARAF